MAGYPIKMKFSFFVRVDFQFLLRMAFTFYQSKRSRLSQVHLKVKFQGQGHLNVSSRSRSSEGLGHSKGSQRSRSNFKVKVT